MTDLEKDLLKKLPNSITDEGVFDRTYNLIIGIDKNTFKYVILYYNEDKDWEWIHEEADTLEEVLNNTIAQLGLLTI